MSDKRSWLKLEIGVGVAFLVLVAVGLLAPRLWRDYQERRRTLIIRIGADGTVLCRGRPVRTGEAEATGRGETLRAIIQRRSKDAGFRPRLLPFGTRSGVTPGLLPVSNLRVRLRVDPAVGHSRLLSVLSVCKEEKISEVRINDVDVPIAERDWAWREIKAINFGLPGRVAGDSRRGVWLQVYTLEDARTTGFCEFFLGRNGSGGIPRDVAEKLQGLRRGGGKYRLLVAADDGMRFGDVLAALYALHRAGETDARFLLGWPRIIGACHEWY